MLKYCIRLFIFMITVQLCTVDVYAASGDHNHSQGNNAECTYNDDCAIGYYCNQIENNQPGASDKTCQSCTNKPTDVNNKECGTEGSLCHYTDSGNDNGICPWTLTCSNGTIFVPTNDGKSGSCQTCQQINNNDTNYQSLLGPNSSYQVKWDGEALQYSTDGTTWENDNPAQCTGKVYRISFDLNSHLAQGGPQNPIYEKYNDGYYSEQQCINQITSISVPYGIFTFDGYWTQRNDGEKIFDSSGNLVSGVDAKKFHNNTTLYAQWATGYVDRKIPVIIAVGGNADKDSTCSFSQNTCTYTINGGSCGSGNYATGTTDTGWTFNQQNMTVSKNFSDPEKFACLERLRQDPDAVCDTVNISVLQCDSGYFCKSCKKTKCPYASTSDGGENATAANKCYFTTIKDNGTTRSGVSVPVADGQKAYISNQLIQHWQNSQNNPSGN